MKRMGKGGAGRGGGGGVSKKTGGGEIGIRRGVGGRREREEYVG